MKSTNNNMDPGTEERSLFWFPFKVDAWHANRAVRLMKDFQKGWYISLIVESWRDAGTIPNDPAILWRLAGAESPEAFDRQKELVLSEFEEAELDGKPVLIHRGMASLYINQSKQYSQKVEAGKRSAEKRRIERENLNVEQSTKLTTEAIQ